MRDRFGRDVIAVLCYTSLGQTRELVIQSAVARVLSYLISSTLWIRFSTIKSR